MPSPPISAGIDPFVATFTSAGAHRFSAVYGDSNGGDGNAIAFAASNRVVFGGRFDGTMNFGTKVIQSAGQNDGVAAALALP